eukprot:TRINITY_DN12537_c0_g1_i1.p1 TRINITY_DN12537_c0_g1~~TRINITY_DN12537_c0_g1_i1.p1  ORF type:complete len:347 (+),score=25.38 TRINITY_DN12537_c0_g1_i1:33-1073(+)
MCIRDRSTGPQEKPHGGLSCLNSMLGTTLGTKLFIGLCILLFICQYALNINLNNFCISTQIILNSNPTSSWFSYVIPFYRLFTSAYFHYGLLHIVFNLFAFYNLGSGLEKILGTIQFIHLIFVFTCLVNIMYLFLSFNLFYVGSSSVLGFFSNSFILDKIQPYLVSQYYQCAVGFSGVLFCLLVIATAHSGQPTSSIFGFFSVPSKIYPWVLLVIFQFMIGGVSLLGHLSGILIGYIYAYGFLERLKLSSKMLNHLESGSMLQRFVGLDGFVSFASSSSSPFSRGDSEEPSTLWDWICFCNKYIPFRNETPKHVVSQTGEGDIESFTPGSPTFPGKGFVLGSSSPK